MEKTIVEFLNDNFEVLDGVTDITAEDGNMVDVWNYDGDKVLFSLKAEDGDVQVTKWHEDNKSVKSTQDYLSPTEDELVEVVEKLLK